MTRHQIKKSRKELAVAGTPKDLIQTLKRVSRELGNDLEVYKRQKEAIQKDFRRQLEQWTTEKVPDSIPVAAIPSQVAEGRLYRRAGFCALFAEMALAGWAFNTLDVFWWIGSLSALLVTYLVHGGLHLILINPHRGKETVHRVKSLVAVPSFIGFLVSLSVFCLARYVWGSMALALLPFSVAALWVCTLSLILVTASLFTVAHLTLWSERSSRDWGRVDANERETKAFLEELEILAHELEIEEIERPPKGLGLNGSVLSMIGPLLFAVWIQTACTGTPSDHFVVQADGEADEIASLHVVIDWSGSPSRPALEEAWETVRRELPEIAETHNIGQATLWAFAEDGWSPRRLSEITLPIFYQTEVPNSTRNSEWEVFRNFKEAKMQERDKLRLELRNAAKVAYHEKLTRALEAWAEVEALPHESHEAHGSDILGLLNRISRMNSSNRQFLILITDLADTRHRDFPVLSAPGDSIRVLILFVPASEKDARLTIGKPLSASQQFDLRQNQLRESIPWVELLPHFTEDLAMWLGGEESRRSNKPHGAVK